MTFGFPPGPPTARITIDEKLSNMKTGSELVALKKAGELINRKGTYSFSRIVFATDNHFDVIASDRVHMDGVIPVAQSSRLHYPIEQITFPDSNISMYTTLVIASNAAVAMKWDKSLENLGYRNERI